MIKIVFDPLGLAAIKNTIIRDISEYPSRVEDCLNSIAEGKDLILNIVEPIMLEWFKNMASRYPQGTFTFETTDARGALAQRWGTTIPTRITNEEIMQSGVLSLDLTPQPGFSFEDIILAHYYAPIFTAKTFPFTQLVALLSSVDQNKWQDNSTIPLISRMLHARLEEWKNKTHSSEQRQFVELFDDDPLVLKQKLMQFHVLQNYPTIGEVLMADTFDLFRTLKLQLDDLKIEESKIPATVTQVTYYLNSQKLQNTDELTAAIEGTSGFLGVEFETIENVLVQHTDWITPKIIEQIEDKFASQSHKISRKIRALRGLIRPSKPGFPELSWNVDAMLSWVTESYLPYQAWCNKQEAFDFEIYQIGDKFSEWLMNNWGDIHSNSKRMVFNILSNKAAELKRTGFVNLVLVIDNLGWSFSEMLTDIFKERNYFLTNAEPYLAMIPSETEISKKCLLAGAVGYQAIDDKTYKAIIEKGWVPYFNDNSFRYISDIGGLNTVQFIDASTYIVNYLAVDKALHSSADEIGMSHHDHIQHLLEKLVDNCITFIEKHGLQENIRIHIVSDHGSTRIPSSLQNDLDPPFFKTNGFEARSHRYVSVSNNRFADLADNLKLDCFFLPANDFLNPDNVLCARRGNRFLPTDKDFYVHGGLSPEEIVVPYMMFEPAIVPIQDLTILLQKDEYRYRMETIELEIGNPNDLAVEQITVSILNGNVESDPIRIALLNGKTNTVRQIKARFKQSNLPEDQTSLRIRIHFSARGEKHTLDIHSKITMKKIVEERSSSVFDD